MIRKVDVRNFGPVLQAGSAVQVITKPGGAKSFSKFKGQLYALKKEEGGRHKPFVTGYRPQFFFRCAPAMHTCHASHRC